MSNLSYIDLLKFWMHLITELSKLQIMRVNIIYELYVPTITFVNQKQGLDYHSALCLNLSSQVTF